MFYEYISLPSALKRVNDALAQSLPVTFTDGTVSRRIVKVYGEDSIIDGWMTLEAETGEQYPLSVTPMGYLDSWNLRKLPNELLIGPYWYLQTWPCNHPCIASFSGICAVPDCQGACDVKYTSNATSAEEAAREYKQVREFLSLIEQRK